MQWQRSHTFWSIPRDSWGNSGEAAWGAMPPTHPIGRNCWQWKPQLQGNEVPGLKMQRRGDMWQQSWQLWALENTLLQTRRAILEACPLLWQLLSRLTPAVGLGFLCLRVLAPPSTEPYQGHPTLPTHPGLQGEVFCWARFSLCSSFPGLLHPQLCAVSVPCRRRHWDGGCHGYPQSICESSTCRGLGNL